MIAYFDNPTAANLATLKAELRTARRMGANSMRIFLELGQVMAGPDRARQRTLSALQRLLGVAEKEGVYLDITGNLVWRPALAPAWYERMSWPARWEVQGAFLASRGSRCLEVAGGPLLRAHLRARRC